MRSYLIVSDPVANNRERGLPVNHTLLPPKVDSERRQTIRKVMTSGYKQHGLSSVELKGVELYLNNGDARQLPERYLASSRSRIGK